MGNTGGSATKSPIPRSYGFSILAPVYACLVEQQTSVGLYLGRLRDQAGLSLREAAKRAGVHFTRLGEWERSVDAHTGKPVTPPTDALLRLARVYGVAPEPLLAMAGYRSGTDPSPEEERLLAAFRQLPEPERAALVAEIEARTGGHAGRPAAPEA